MLIGLASDRPRTGKSTAANHLRDRHGFAVISIGDCVKNELDTMLRTQGFRYSEELKEEFRAGLSWWTECRIRNSGHDYWLQAIERQLQPNRATVVSDIRYPDEAKYIKELGGSIIKIERNQAQRSSLASETALDDYAFECVIENIEGDNGSSMFAQLDQMLARLQYAAVLCEGPEG